MWHKLRHTLSTVTSKAGMFGINNLREPKDWSRLAGAAIERCQGLIQEAVLLKPSVQVIQRLDDISDTVCQVYDAAEFCRNVHSDPIWCEAAHQTCTQLAGFIHELNNNKGLYSALLRALDRHEALTKTTYLHSGKTETSRAEGFTREAVVVGKLLKRDFEMAGIHLEAHKQEEFTQLTASIHQTGFSIVSNIAAEKHKRPGDPGCRAVARSEDLIERSERSREMAFRTLLRTPEENISLLDTLAAQRHQLAVLLGAPSYAHYTLSGATLAGTPDAAIRFMDDLNQALQPKLLRYSSRVAAVQVFTTLQMELELRDLQCTKREFCTGKDKSPLRPWDLEFCRHFRNSVVDKRLLSLREHFHIHSVLKGLAEILKRTFGVTMSTENMQPDEAWADHLVKLSLSHETDGALGVIYLDLFRRPRKFAGSAHFTLRCKRQLSDGSLQLPVVALAFNCSSAFLGPGEAETLFHEFGHALHSLLSRTQFQHLAGTRGPLDMIEIPSHFFEHFIRRKACLELCTGHYQTGDQLPQPAVKAFLSSRNRTPALYLNDSIVYAMMDQTFHGAQSSGESQSAKMSTVVEQYSAFQDSLGKDLHWHIRFGHLVNYGASYYSYVYSKFIADAVWKQHFAQDPFSREAGAHVRTKLLDLGGTKDPKQLIDGLLGAGSLLEIGGGWAPVTGIA